MNANIVFGWDLVMNDTVAVETEIIFDLDKYWSTDLDNFYYSDMQNMIFFFLPSWYLILFIFF